VGSRHFGTNRYTLQTRMQRSILVPSPPQAEEPRDLSSNRYTLQIEISATPTKQTVGTRANRYDMASVGSVPLWQIPTRPPGLETDAND
jgi:hypothetical protein